MNKEDLKTKAEIYVSEFLQKYGIQPNVRGYFFLRTAVIMYMEDDTVLLEIRTRLYSEIAKKYKTTPQRVDSSMRNAIEAAWKNDSSGNTMKNLKNCSGKPSSAEFIAYAAEQVRNELMKK